MPRTHPQTRSPVPMRPVLRGYHVQYQGGGRDICPGCGRRQFYVGTASAECAHCATALPLPVSMTGVGLVRASK